MSALWGVGGSVKLCLASSCTALPQTIPRLKEVPFLLESFYYVKDFQIPLIHSADLFLLDSGAFTFMSNSKKAVDWDEYVSKYIAFINANDVKHFFELDIDSVVGYEKVKELRRRIEAETGKQCIPVWHKSRGVDEWKALCDNYKYISIGGIVTGEITKQEYPQMKKLVQYADHRGVRVHGLGFTGAGVEGYGFYSVDSTSWLSFRRFGQCHMFDGNRMRSIPRPKGMRVCTENYPMIEEYILGEWIKYQKFLARR